MLHEMSETMEDMLRSMIEELEAAREKVTETISDLEGQAPLDEDLDGIDPAWEGTTDEACLDDRVSFMQDAESQLDDVIRAITDAIER